MTYRKSTDNLLALILVLVISLITVPVFAMPVHHSSIPAASSTSDHSMSMASADCHQPQHHVSQAGADCCSEAELEAAMSSGCSDCDLTQCQTYCSALPIGSGPDTHLPQQRFIPLFAAVQPISRTETLFRPPIL